MASNVRSKEERRLRQAVLRGDEAAWRLLYERSFDPLCRFARSRTDGDRERADELVQEVWYVAVRRIRDFDPDRGSFTSWLFGVASGLSRNERRARRPRERSLIDVAEDESGPDMADTIGTVMAVLPAHYREVLLQKYQEQRSVREIAKDRGGTGKAVESLLTRARAAFRETFERLQES